MIITHDLGVVAGVADRVLVMYAGRVCELADVESVFYTPAHPYTQGLLGSLPRLDARSSDRLARIVGQPPSLMAMPSGCPFHPRCPHALVPGICSDVRPELEPLQVEGHAAACHRTDEIEWKPLEAAP
jgi:oligopeptide/dipeptide ABC transporter ATP-binding protein